VVVAGPRGPLRLYTLAVPRAAAAARDDDTRSESAPSVTVVVQVARNLSEVDRNVGEVREALALAIPIALVLGTLGSFLVARRATAPIARLSKSAAEIDPSSLEKRLDLAHTEGELLDLARTLNAAFDRLAGAVERERRFASDVAHELRTPLAITRGELELALSRERTPVEYRDAIREGLAANGRLEALVSSLLLLARAESSVLEKKPVDLGAVVTSAIDSLVPESRRAGVTVRASLPSVPCFVLANPSLLERLVANLVENAIRYGPSPQGVEVALEVSGPRATIFVRDRGPGLPEEFIARAFARFSRADESRARVSGGAGLGLSIVRAIARAHGGDVAARPREGGGAEFVVDLPLTMGG
jgi:signal transduction histidine kinase